MISTLSGMEGVANFLRFKLLELERLDIVIHNHNNEAASLLISQIIFKLLPNHFRKELCHRSKSSYPSYEQFLDNCTQNVDLLTIDK